jgi:hypothetical protein
VIHIDNTLIVYLEVSSWRGLSIGAQHYYGSLVGHAPEYKRVELYRTLTQADADRLTDRRNDGYKYREGGRTNGFDTPGDVAQFAVKHWREHFPGGKILLKGSAASYEPHTPLTGGTTFKRYTRGIIKRCESLGWYDKGNDKEVDLLCDEWYSALLKEILVIDKVAL